MHSCVMHQLQSTMNGLIVEQTQFIRNNQIIKQQTATGHTYRRRSEAGNRSSDQ